MVCLSFFSKAGTDAVEGGGVEGNADRRDSTSSVKPSQFALSKFMKVFLTEGRVSEDDWSVMLIGRWSEERATEVDHEALTARAGEAREMSGEVGEDPEGRRVGVSSFRGQKSD